EDQPSTYSDYIEVLTEPDGSRVIGDFYHMLSEGKKLEKHEQECDQGGKMVRVKVISRGLHYAVLFQCNYKPCSHQEVVTNDPQSNQLHKLAVLAAIATG